LFSSFWSPHEKWGIWSFIAVLDTTIIQVSIQTTHIISGVRYSKPLSKLFNDFITTLKTGHMRYHDTSFSSSGVDIKKFRIKELIQHCFSNKNIQQRFEQYLVIVKDNFYFVKGNSILTIRVHFNVKIFFNWKQLCPVEWTSVSTDVRYSNRY
jgi:hypothetical protein